MSGLNPYYYRTYTFLLVTNYSKFFLKWSTLTQMSAETKSRTVMSPDPAFLPLTTRGHHLLSSRTPFPKLHTPVRYYTLSCLPLSWTHHAPATLSGWIVFVVVFFSGDTCTVLPTCVSHSLNCCVCCLVGLFVY